MLKQEESYKSQKLIMDVAERPTRKLLISVVIPTRKLSNDFVTLQCLGELKQVEIIVCRQKGVAKARNEGAYAAHGEIICFMEDDLVFKDRDILNLLNLYTPNTVITCHNTIPKRPMIGRITIISKEDFQRVGGFNEYIRFGGEGADFILRCMDKGLRWIPLTGALYRHVSRKFSSRIEIVRCFFETYVTLKWKRRYRQDLFKFWISAHKFPCLHNLIFLTVKVFAFYLHGLRMIL